MVSSTKLDDVGVFVFGCQPPTFGKIQSWFPIIVCQVLLGGHGSRKYENVLNFKGSLSILFDKALKAWV